MSVVLDTNLLIVLATDDARAPLVSALVERWSAAHDAMHAPSLLPYEFANGLTRLIVAGQLPMERVGAAWRILTSMPINYHPLHNHGETVVRIARRLQRASAYDAAYIALAQELGAELWTFDGPLARNARSLGYPVQLVE